MFSGLLQKDHFKGKRSLAKRYLKTKLLSRLSHKVCRLLTPPVLLRKFTSVLSDGRQPEVDFLHHWGMVWLKLSGKSSLKEKRNSAIQVC